MKALKASAPVLTKCNHRYELRISYEMAGSKFPKYKKDKEVETVIGVDLGINTDAVCSVIHKDGTVAGQRFINHPVEKDRMHGLLNAIKMCIRDRPSCQALQIFVYFFSVLLMLCFSLAFFTVPVVIPFNKFVIDSIKCCCLLITMRQHSGQQAFDIHLPCHITDDREDF